MQHEITDDPSNKGRSTIAPNWSQLWGVGNNRIIRSSYYWLFIVPFAARVVLNAPDDFGIDLFGLISPLMLCNLKLPFSWQLFYGSAVFAAIGTAVYQMMAPPLVARYRHFEEFWQQGNSKWEALYLTEKHIDLYHSSRKSEKERILVDSILSRYSAPHLLANYKEKEGMSLRYLLQAADELDRNDYYVFARDVFSVFRNFQDNDGRYSRWIITIVFFFSFLLIVGVVLQNVLYVLEASEITCREDNSWLGWLICSQDESALVCNREEAESTE